MALFVVGLLGLAVVGAMSGTVAADHADNTDDRIQVVDAFSESHVDFFDDDGNVTIAVQAMTTDPVSDLQFYDETAGEGPLNFANGGIRNAEYDNGTTFTESNSFSSASGDYGIVFFELNQSWSQSETQINVSTGGTAYEQADREDRTVLTANAYGIAIENASNDRITDEVGVAVTNDTDALEGYFMVNDGEDLLHCGGVLDGDSCIDPETNGPAHTYPITRSAHEPTSLPADPTLNGIDPVTMNRSNGEGISTSGVTLTLDQPTALVQFQVQNYTGGHHAGVDEIRVETRNGDTVLRWLHGASSEPIPLDPKTDYDVVIERGSETHRRPMMLPTKGFTRQEIRIAGDLPAGDDPAMEEVLGQVINESGAPVENVTVTAEPSGWGGEPPAVNSTVTDENGLFAMELPQTNEQDPIIHRYQFQLASNRTNNDVLTYFPTRDNSQGDGYEVRDSRTIVGQLEIRQGGEVGINVTNATGGTIDSGEAITSLSQTTTETSDRTRQSLVETFSVFSFPGTEVEKSAIRVPSPTTGLEDNVSYNVWGFDQDGFNELCAEQADVSQGVRTPSDCELENGGTLNVTLDQYASIRNTAGTGEPLPVGDPGRYYRNTLLVRNATTGNVTTYLGPGSIQQYFIEDGDRHTLSLPVPKGDYTVELRPTNQWVDRTSVRNSTTVSVSEGETKSVALESGRDFYVEPDMERTDRTLRRTDDNSITVRVADPETGDPLDGSDVDVSAQLLYRNGTVAGETVPLEHNTIDAFENTTYTPSVAAGGYTVELRVTYEDGNSLYNTTIREELIVSDFAADLQTRRATVPPGESFDARLRAFDLTTEPPMPIDADADNISLTLYDRNGNAIDNGTSNDALVDGRGTIEIPAIGDTGLYRIGVVVEADDGRQGIAETWVRVSPFDVDVSLDRSVYAPSDTVNATVEVSDGAGNPVPDAKLESTVGSDNGTVTIANSTDADGVAEIELDPGSLFDGTDTWDGPTFLHIEATIATDDGLKTVFAGSGIDVRSFQADVSASRSQYADDEEPVIDVAVPPGIDIESVNATRINGQDIDDVTGTEEADGFYRITLDSDLANYEGIESGDGTFRVTVEVTNANGRTITDRARFDVSSVTVRAEPSARSYEPDELIDVTAEVRYQNGSRADGEAVSLELYELGENPIQVDTNSTTTDGDGTATEELSPDSSGLHGVVVSSGGSERVFPVLISDITTTFKDGSGAEVDTYEFTPGQSDAMINITAENGTDDPIDGRMEVHVIIGGERIELGNSQITDGEGGVVFSVPESANTGEYPVEVIVTQDGVPVDSKITQLELTGGVSLEVDARKSVYTPDEEIRLRATATDGSGAVSGEPVEFTLLSSNTERTLGSGETGDDGSVSITETVPGDLTDGEYAVRARTDGGVTAFDGILVSDTDLSIEMNESAYAAGETVSVNLTATSDGDPVSDAEGGVRIRLADGTTVTESFDGTGENSPYQVTIDVPDDADAVGTRTLEGFVRNGSSVAVDGTTIEVFNATESASLSVPDGIIANETQFTIEANATVDTDGGLTVFSPGTESVVHQAELNLNASESLSLSEPGTYVFSLSVPGVGTETVVRNADAAPDDPSVKVGPDLSTNATTFESNDDIHIRTEGEDMTAEVIGPDESFTVSLTREDGGTHYGVLPESEVDSGPYLVRLDGQTTTDVDSVLIEVSD